MTFLGESPGSHSPWNLPRRPLRDYLPGGWGGQVTLVATKWGEGFMRLGAFSVGIDWQHVSIYIYIQYIHHIYIDIYIYIWYTHDYIRSQFIVAWKKNSFPARLVYDRPTENAFGLENPWWRTAGGTAPMSRLLFSSHPSVCGCFFPKIGGFDPPKRMVKIMENPVKMDDLVVFPLFLETPMYETAAF